VFLITVENSLEDKRQKFLTLTPKGHELYEIVCLDVQNCVPPLIIFHEFVSSHLWFLAFDLAKCLFWQLLLVGAFVHQDITYFHQKFYN
jgi:DNA-binding MarR family transcriptional regulator